jgi:hypothetical protein
MKAIPGATSITPPFAVTLWFILTGELKESVVSISTSYCFSGLKGSAVERNNFCCGSFTIE